jgi:RNA polymerase sigma-70 factor (ECF subfamily)
MNANRLHLSTSPPDVQPSDEHLLFLLRNDDAAAFDVIYKRYWQLLFNTAYKNLNNLEQCKEIVHDVLVDIWQRRKTLEVGHLPAYLKTAVRFRSINFIVRHQQQPFLELIDDAINSPYSAESTLLTKEAYNLIETYIKLLPEKRRDIFILSFFRQLSTREIAAELNISKKTVQNQLGTTLRYLRKKISHLLFCFGIL